MRKIVLLKRTANRLGTLLDYLASEWSLTVKNEFVTKLDHSLKQIQKYPESCPKTSVVNGLHMLVVTKQTSIFYRFDAETITIVTIFDNCMNPDKLKNETT